MKSKHLLLTLLLALLVPWAANAQSTLPVCNGTTTSSYAPIKSSGGSQTEFIYPASLLGAMEGGKITSVKFFSSQTTTTNYTNKVTVYVQEVAETTETTSAWRYNQATATKVYEGTTLSVTDGELVITFSTPYEYNGGNLCFNIWSASSTPAVNYYYLATTSACGYDYYITPPVSNPYATGNYLPKAEFTYTPAPTPTSAPGVTTSETVANLTNTTVTLGGNITDMGGANSVQAGICYSTTSEPTTSDGHVQSSCTSTGAYTRNITGLLPNTTYYFRAYAYSGYNSLENPTYGDIYSFTTAGSITLTQPANGEISVSVAGGTPTTSNTYALPGQSVTLTATPASGYDLDCWTVTGVTGTASGNTYTFTMPSNNVTATASIIPTSGGSSSETYYELATTVESGEKYLIVNGTGTTASASTTFYAMERNNTSSTSGYLDYGTPTFKDSENHQISGITPRTSGHALSEFVWTITASGSDYTISAENQGSTYYLIETTAGDGNLHSYTTSNTGYDENKTKWTIYKSSTVEYFNIHNPYWHELYTSGTRYYYLYKHSSGFENYWDGNASQTGQNYRMYLYKETSVTTYAITATASPAEGGTVAGSDYYASGSTCTLTATPAFGYEFVSWTEGGVVVSTNEEYTFTVSSARTLVANFETQGSCIKPTDLAQVGPQAAHQAQLSWTENSGATQWQVVYSTNSEFDPDDATPIDVNENPVTIPGLSQATTYYARVRAICGQNSQSGWSSQAPFSTISGRQAPTVSPDLATLTADEVTVNWTGVATNVLHQSYDLYYSTDPVMPAILDPTTLIVGLTGNSHHLTGLTSETLNYVWVRDNCGDDGYSDWSTPVSFEPTAKIAIGSGTGTNSYLPSNTNWKYDLTQQIYTVAELGDAGIIESIDFYVTSTSGTTRTWDVYMVSTDKESFTGTADWIAVTDADRVFSGNVTFAGDAWTTITLDEAFVYNGTQNVAIIVDDNTGNYNDGTKYFRSFTATATQAIYYYNDDNNYDPTGTPGNASGTTTSKNQIRILKTPMSDCMKPTGLTYTEVGNHSAKLSWTENGTAEAWVIDYNGNTIEANTNPFTLPGLDASTPYTVKVRPACDTEGKLWSNPISFTTEVACPAPTNVTASNVTNNSANINWEGDAANYQVRYREYEASEAPTTATIILTVDGDVWGDGSGYQMVLDADATIVDNYSEMTDYSDCEYLIPDDATYDSDGSVVFDESVSITIPAGTYDWIIFNPVSGDGVYVAGGDGHYGNVGGYQDNYVFEAGKTYEFVVSYDGTNGYDRVDVTITNTAKSGESKDNAWTVVENATSPQTISPLTAETTYEVQVQAVCGGIDGESDWTTSITFTTLSNCAAPTELNAAVTASSATLSWIGAQDKYNVRYSKLVAGPEVTTTEDFSGQNIAAYSSTGELPDGWHSYTTQSYTPHVCNSSSYSYISNLDGNYLLMTTNNSNTASVYAIMPKYDNLTAVSFNYAFESTSSCGSLEVGYVTDNTGYSTFSKLQEIEPEDTDWNSYTLTAADIATINNNKGYIAFKYNSNSTTYYSAAIDNVSVSYQALTPGAWVNRTEVTSPLLIENLDNNSKYAWQVQGINASCGADGVTDWSETAYFTTPYPTFTRVINGYGTNDGGYVLVASPLAGETNPTNVENMIDAEGNYDLYYFDQAQDLEWINYKDSENGGGYNLVNGKGYLYANKNTVTLTITGAPYSGSGEIDLTYSASAAEFPGWNLIGNPFATPATLDRPFYKMNETGDGFTAKIEDLTNTIAVMEGVFVEATTTDEKATFTAQEASKGGQAIAQTNIVVSGNKGQVLDNAIIRFDNGETLGKFSFRENNAKIYIPMEGKDYAVVNAGKVGEIPVSFKAEKNGSYSLSFTSQEVTFSYLHLIDNLTGNDVNLLANPSYSFDAQTTDYAQRFRLVFATGSSVDGDSFGFINGMGNLCIFGIEGNATLQVMDVTGRILSSETFSGSYEKNLNVVPGVYMLRLMNGDNVKVQKVVVR